MIIIRLSQLSWSLVKKVKIYRHSEMATAIRRTNRPFPTLRSSEQTFNNEDEAQVDNFIQIMKLYSNLFQTLQNVSVLIPSTLYHYNNKVSKKI